MKRLNFIELFAGAGGLSEGFIQNGYNPIAFIEKDMYCCTTLKTRQAYFELRRKNKMSLYRQYLLQEISREELYQHIPQAHLNTVINREINQDSVLDFIKEVKNRLKGKKLDLILGGPPCQAYSLIGRAQNKHKKDDKRLYMYEYYLRFLKELKPTTFIFENVPGLLSIDKGELFKKIITDFEKLGYKVSSSVLNAHHHDVLQLRKRLIVVGNLDGKIDLESLKGNKNSFTVDSIFSDLQPLSPSETNNKYISSPNHYLNKNKIRQKNDVLTLHQARSHNKRDLAIYKHVITRWNKDKKRLKYTDLPEQLKTHKNEQSFLDRFKVVCSDLPASHTMVAHIAKDGHHYIHPDINQCRSISVREAARIQSFPDNFFFEGPRTSQFTQIGNAVPPLLSKALAKNITQYET